METPKTVTLHEQYSLAHHTAMHLPCEARYFIVANDREGVKWAIDFAEKRSLPLMVIGGGSNIVFSSDRYDGVALELGKGFRKCERIDEDHIEAGCALSTSKLLEFCRKNLLGNLEFLAGIPGTVGGAVIGNSGAGAHGICQFTSGLKAIDYSLKDVVMQEGDFRYAYRWTSITNMVLYEATLNVLPTTLEQIEKETGEFVQLRQDQPKDFRSAGCIFKNPPNDSAGRLIEEAGLKGYTVGGAKVSEDHANFIINFNNAEASDVLELIEYIRKIVYSKFEIRLSLEVDLV